MRSGEERKEGGREERKGKKEGKGREGQTPHKDKKG